MKTAIRIRQLGLALVTAALLACSADGGTLGSESSAEEKAAPSVAPGTSLTQGATTIVLLRDGTPGGPICEDGRGQFTLGYAIRDYESDICQFGGDLDARGGEPLDSAVIASLLPMVRAIAPAKPVMCVPGFPPDTADVTTPAGTVHYASCGTDHVATGISEAIDVAFEVSVYAAPSNPPVIEGF